MIEYLAIHELDNLFNLISKEMAKKLTYEQRKVKIVKSYDQKKYQLRKRIEMKYEGKIEREFDRKSAVLDRRMEQDLHNLKVDMPTDKRKRKRIVREPSRTSIKKATRHWFSKAIRISLSKKVGKAYIAECYTHELSRGEKATLTVVRRDPDEGRFIRYGTQPGHMIKKGTGDSLKFYRPVYRLQCGTCNVLTAEDQKAWEAKRHSEVGEKIYQEAIQEKGKKFDMSKEEMLKLKEFCKSYVEAKLEELRV